jgi:hypothetical protein
MDDWYAFIISLSSLTKDFLINHYTGFCRDQINRIEQSIKPDIIFPQDETIYGFWISYPFTECIFQNI